ncbi:MAG TPA: type II toxin-antitoxin system VapC family toxin [Bacilli bacterium]
MSNLTIVLDTSAYLTLVHLETGHEVVSQRLMEANCVMSMVNLAEVLSKQAEFGIPTPQALALFHLTGVHLESFSSKDAELTGTLRQPTRAFGLSLGDRACLALGRRLCCPVMTADRLWSQLELGIDVLLIR